MKLHYKKMTYVELISTILDCQIELYKRGTITKCRNIFFTDKQKCEFITIEPLQSEVTNDEKITTID